MRILSASSLWVWEISYKFSFFNPICEATILAGIIRLLTSLAGLPEVDDGASPLGGYDG